MRWLAAFAALSVVLTSVLPLEAQERSTSAERSSRAVPVVIAGDPDPRATEATLRDLLAHLSEPIALEVTAAPEIDPRSITDPPPSRPAAFARVWIDVRSETCVVSIADTTWERIYQRRMPRPGGNDDVTREQIAQIVVSAIEAMLAGGTIGVARASLAPSPPPPPPIVPPSGRDVAQADVRGKTSSEAGLRANAVLGVGYEALAFSSSTIAHGPLASVRGSIEEGNWTLGLDLSAQWRAPLVVDEAPIGVRLDTKSFRLVLEGARVVSPRVTFRAGVGPGLDVIDIEPRGVSRSGEGGEPTVTVEAKRSRVSPVLRWSLGVDVRAAPGVHVALAAVLDHALTNRAYVVRQQGIEREVLAPFDLRPGLTLSIAADLVRP